jgi:inner membrane protein
MTGKTHMAVGVGTALTLLQTKDIKVIIGGTVLALIGSIIVDIDTEKSNGSKLVREIFATLAIVILLGVFLKIKYNVNTLGYITSNKSIMQMSPALLLLLVMVVLGKLSTHRTFTHSLIGIVAFTLPIYMLVGSLYIWFLIGYIVHIIADLLNKKNVRLFYPIKGGVSLGLCSADGIVDKILLSVFLFIIATFYVHVIQGTVYINVIHANLLNISR